MGGGYDEFGVRWEAPSPGSGGSVPANDVFLMDDIAQWREKVVFPNLEAVDWDQIARTECEDCKMVATYNPNKHVPIADSRTACIKRFLGGMSLSGYRVNMGLAS